MVGELVPLGWMPAATRVEALTGSGARAACATGGAVGTGTSTALAAGRGTSTVERRSTTEHVRTGTCTTAGLQTLLRTDSGRDELAGDGLIGGPAVRGLAGVVILDAVRVGSCTEFRVRVGACTAVSDSEHEDVDIEGSALRDFSRFSESGRAAHAKSAMRWHKRSGNAASSAVLNRPPLSPHGRWVWLLSHVTARVWNAAAGAHRRVATAAAPATYTPATSAMQKLKR